MRFNITPKTTHRLLGNLLIHKSPIVWLKIQVTPNTEIEHENVTTRRRLYDSHIIIGLAHKTGEV